MEEAWFELVSRWNRLVLRREPPRDGEGAEVAERFARLVEAARGLDDEGLWGGMPAFAFHPGHPAYGLPPAAPERVGAGPQPARRPLRPPAAAPAPGGDRRPPLAAPDPEARVPLWAWRRRLARGEVSAVELVRAALARIEALDGRVRAFVTVAAQEALAAAAEADRRLREGTAGPLAGLPVAVKDIVDVAGLPTTAGSRLLAGRVAAADAHVTARLRAAGAVIVGKTATHEFAFGTTTDTPFHGPVHNPWDPERTAGGSSGGSGAAVAAGMVGAALGTDTAGSIRIPAALCGTVGLMPTFGRVGRSGIVPLSWSCDHVGPLAGTVADAALLLEALAGPDPADPATGPGSADGLAGLAEEALRAARAAAAGERPLAGLRVGVPREEWLGPLHPDVGRALAGALRALADLGAELWEVELPPRERLRLVNRLIVLAEAGALHAPALSRRAADYSPPVRARLELGVLVPARDYLLAQRLRAECVRAVRQAMAELDLLALPAVATPAPRLGQAAWDWPHGPEPVPDLLIRLTAPFNVTGQPALAVPAGLSGEDLPVAVQLVGHPFGERQLVRAGAALEAVLGVAPPAAAC